MAAPKLTGTPAAAAVSGSMPMMGVPLAFRENAVTANPVTMPAIAPAAVNLRHQTLSTRTAKKVPPLSENASITHLSEFDVPALAGHEHARAKHQHDEARDDEPPAGRRGFVQEAGIEVVAHGVSQRDELGRGGRRDRGQRRCRTPARKRPPGRTPAMGRMSARLSRWKVTLCAAFIGSNSAAGKRYEAQVLKDAAPGRKARTWVRRPALPPPSPR